MMSHFLIIITHQGLISEDALRRTPCDNLCYHPTNAYSSLSEQGTALWTGLGHEICFGQWNVSGHDLSPASAEARNVFAWFGLASWPPALHCGESMLQGSRLLGASLALTVPP